MSGGGRGRGRGGEGPSVRIWWQGMVRSFVRFSVSPSLAFSATLRVYVWWVVAYLVRHGGAARGLVGRVNAVFSAGVFLRDGRCACAFGVSSGSSGGCFRGVTWARFPGIF